MAEKSYRYNKVCPAHDHTCWSHRQLMREDDLVCTQDYRRLPSELKNRLWKVKDGLNAPSNLSIVVDWLLEHPLDSDTNCTDKGEK